MINFVTTPAILTDALFAQYGGNDQAATTAQKQAAYAIAESQAAQEVGTYLSATTITGTYSWPQLGDKLQLPHSHLVSVGSVVAVHDAGCDCAADSVEITGCAWILDSDGGLVSLRECGNTVKASCSGCNCGNRSGGGPLQVRIAYTAGLPTGTADPRLMMGLVTAADLALQQMLDPAGAEGGAGDPGLKNFSSLSYSETRADGAYRVTAFGSSARANYAAKLLSNFKYHRAGKLGW